MSDKYNRNSAEHAHFRIDNVENDVEQIKKFVGYAKKTADNSTIQKWMVALILLVMTGDAIDIEKIIKVLL